MLFRTSVIPGLLLAILAACAMAYGGQPIEQTITVFVLVLCIFWWIFEPIPIPVTSLLPLALFPVTGVLSSNQVAEAYGSPLILLLLGGFVLSQGMEATGAHRRLALGVVRLVGADSPRRVIFGFMAAGALLSMWISNTATVLMLLPVALAVIAGVSARREQIATPLLLGLAWACSVGGLGTPIGTPPNLLFLQIYSETTGREVSFSQWMRWGVPIVVVLVPLLAIWLTRRVPRDCSLALPDVGPWRSAERRVLAIFVLTALAWITRSEPFGGWREWLGLPGASDASVALLAVVAVFMVRDREGQPLLGWQDANRIPWGVLLLFSGGICLAKAFTVSGLSAAVGDALSVLVSLPLPITILSIALLVTFLTEATSNTATTALLMPVLAAAGLAAGVDPIVLMLPAVMSASCAFMLPVATAPNAVVYGSEQLKVSDMVREGVIANLIGAAVVTALISLVVV
jgi:sodium-dependent dicarboxylate transporter 2/3/5